MADRPQGKKHKIVNFGEGPHIYGGEFIGLMFDGTCVTIHVGNMEARMTEVDGKLDPPVVAHSGKVTLSPKAATQLVNQLTRLITVVSGGEKQDKPVMN